jgi:hypothetical protein
LTVDITNEKAHGRGAVGLHDTGDAKSAKSASCTGQVQPQERTRCAAKPAAARVAHFIQERRSYLSALLNAEEKGRPTLVEARMRLEAKRALKA